MKQFLFALVLLFPSIIFAQDAAKTDVLIEPNRDRAVNVAMTSVTVARQAAIPDLTQFSAGKHAPKQLAIVISGGASLGTYQAGFMYFLTEVVKATPEFDLRVFTGASAGSANGLISLVNTCLPRNPNPLDDVGFKVWAPVGYYGLFDEDKVTGNSIFDRTAMQKTSEEIWKAFEQGFPESCDIVFGVTTTRVEAERIELVPGLTVPNQTVRFVVRVTGRGVGKPVRIKNYVNQFSRTPEPVLPFKAAETQEASRHNFEVLRDTVFASMAYPVAFAPVEIDYCEATFDPKTGTSGPFECETPTHTDTFVDGGVYDNNPLRLALHLERRGLEVTPQGQIRWRPAELAPDEQEFARYNGTSYLYVDQDTFAYPSEPPRVRAPKQLQLLEQLQVQASNFVETARARELFALVNEDPTLGERMRLTTANFPTVSAHIGAFMGLLEYDFRYHDFYMGMYDGYKNAVIAMEQSGLRVDLRTLFGIPEDPAQVDPQWRPFTCILGTLEPGFEAYQRTCNEGSLHNFRVLTQIALDRVYAHCSQLEKTDENKTTHHHCQLAMAGKEPPHVSGVSQPANAKHWRYQDGEEEFDHTMRLMADYGFHFRDLGLEPDEAERGRVKIRRKLLKMVKYIADAQDSVADRTALLTVGRSAVNSIEYEPPVDWLYVLLGSASEIGMSLLPWDWNYSWARLHWSVQVYGLFQLITRDQDDIQISPMIGGELELLPITNQYVQFMLGLRGGYQMSTHDWLNPDNCSGEDVKLDNRLCSQPILSPYFAMSLLERLRLQLSVNIYPLTFDFTDDNNRTDIWLGIGAQFF